MSDSHVPSNPSPETELFHDAIKAWWESKKSVSQEIEEDGARKQAREKKKQGGTRDAVLHGKSMDGFTTALREYAIGLGVKPEHIFPPPRKDVTKPSLNPAEKRAPAILPSYFRASKNWDFLIVGASRFYRAEGDIGDPILYAAVEFKSQDDSIGNNQNNRLEESIGNAHDFWATYEHSGFLRHLPRPWLGYLFVGKHDVEASEKGVMVDQPHFPAMKPFRREGSDRPRFMGPSYAERYKIFMRQSVGTRLYDAGALLVTDGSLKDQRPNHRILAPEFGPESFLRSLKAHLLAHYPLAVQV